MNIKPPTILTNLQRGNVKQESPMLLHQRTIHELAAQGELYSIEPNFVEALDGNNMTPLIWAAGYGQNSTVEFLLRSGAYPNHKADGGKTALMFAASKGFFHSVKTLIRFGANVNDNDDAGNTPLIYAALGNHALVVQELLKNDANLATKNIYEQTAYSIALAKHKKAAQASIEAYIYGKTIS